MGYSIFLEAVLEIALSLFPLFEGSAERDANMKGSQNDPEEIYSLGGHERRSMVDTYD